MDQYKKKLAALRLRLAAGDTHPRTRSSGQPAVWWICWICNEEISIGQQYAGPKRSQRAHCDCVMKDLKPSYYTDAPGYLAGYRAGVHDMAQALYKQLPIIRDTVIVLETT